MLLLLVLTLLAYEAKGLENNEVDSHAKLQNFPSKAGEILFHHRPYSRPVHPGQNQKPDQGSSWPRMSIKNTVPEGPDPIHHSAGVKAETSCSIERVRIMQDQTGALPDGTPLYTVQIVNECDSGCTVHLSCASFRSEKLVNPKVLRMIAPNDCLLNDGKPLPSDDTISFEYASPTQFPFKVNYLVC